MSCQLVGNWSGAGKSSNGSVRNCRQRCCEFENYIHIFIIPSVYLFYSPSVVWHWLCGIWNSVSVAIV